MMNNITKVALVADTRPFTFCLVTQLVNTGFRVTILDHARIDYGFPTGITYSPVDYNSLSSLSNALEGQDAFVSTLDKLDFRTQLLLVEAAAKAHVKRFIPGVFSANILNEKLRGLPYFRDKVDIQYALEKKAASGALTYSFICTGPMLDFEIRTGTIVNLRLKTIRLFDGGIRVFSTTSLPTIGEAIVGVLTHLEQTKNRVLYVQDTATTLQKLAVMGERATGRDGWRKTVVSVDEMLEQAFAVLGIQEPGLGHEFYLVAWFGKGYGSHFENNDNELLGIEGMDDAEVQELVTGMADF